MKEYQDYQVLETYYDKRGQHTFIIKIIVFQPYPSKEEIQKVAKTLTPANYNVPTGSVSGIANLGEKEPIISYHKFTFAPKEVRGTMAAGW